MCSCIFHCGTMIGNVFLRLKLWWQEFGNFHMYFGYFLALGLKVYWFFWC
jgi:hypothetical protein